MALREILAHFGIEVDSRELNEANDKIEKTIGTIQRLGTALIGGTMARGLAEVAERISAQGAAIDDASVRIGIGATALQELGFVADQSGSNIESLTVALLQLQDKVGDSLVNPAGEGAKVLARYGISAKDASGHVKDAATIFGDIADKIADTKDEAKQVTIAMDFFGRQGRSLLPTLKNGRDGIANLTREFHDLGGGFSPKAIKAAADYDDALSRFRLTGTSLSGQFSEKLLPTLQHLLDLATEGTATFVDFANHSSILEVTFAALGAVMAGFAVKSAIAFAPWLLWAAAIAGVILIVDDLVTMLRSGDSVIGDFLDTIGGKGFHTEVVKELKEEWGNIAEVFKGMAPAVKVFLEMLQFVWRFGKGIAEILGQIGGYLGDSAAQLDNYLEEHGGHGGQAQKNAATKGTGLTYEQNAARRQALRLLAAESSGNTAGFQVDEFPASFKGHEDAFVSDVQHWADFLRNQQATASASPGAAPANGGATVVQHNQIHVHDATDPHRVAKVVDERLSERHRAAADALHKKREAQ